MDPNIYALVLDTLNRATSQDTQVLKPAEKRLQEWEIEPGFYSVLLEILSNHTVDVNIRWLAVMCFKNGVDRYWRQTAPNAISEEEKQKLRLGLLSTNILSEPIAQIATQQAVLISKIARFDCPAAWPSLVPELMGALKAPAPLVQHRALLAFHHVVKALASKRLAADRRMFQELTASVYPFVLSLWHDNTEHFLRHIRAAAPTELITEHLERALLCLRVLRKLTVFGFKKLNKSEEAMSFLNVIFDRARTSLECRKLLKGRGIYLLELCEKFIIHLTKVILGVLGTHPSSYVPLIRPSLEFAIYFCFTEQGMSLIYERFTIQCLNILKGILQCDEYKRWKGAEETNPAHDMKMSVLDEGAVRQMCRHLVTHYFPLSADDLAMWDAEPESFATDEAGDSWKYSMRPCTEAVFMELFREFRGTLAPELVRLLAELQQQQVPAHDLQGILRKDAVYNAVGLAAFDLYDDVDFDQWFTNVLSQELRITDDNYRIIRRRICQLIGQWCGVRASQSIRPAMYESLLEAMSRPAEDPAVKLAAAEALRSTIDDFNFKVEQFTPYVPHALSALYELLVEAEECDTKMHVLHVLSYVVERCGAAARAGGGGAGGAGAGAGAGTDAGAVFAYLPQLWASAAAAAHNMLQAAVLSAVVPLIKALGECPQSIRSWVLGAVNEATCLTKPAHVYLLEDALDLWLAILKTSQHADAELMLLAENLNPILESSTEFLKPCVLLMEGYTLLAPEAFLCGAGARCLASLEDMLADMRPEGRGTVLKISEVCLSISFPERNRYLGVKVVWPILIRAVRCILTGDDLPMVLALQLCLLSRVILLSPELFYKCVEEAAAGGAGGGAEAVLDRLLQVWTERMNLVTHVERSKLVALGLAALLTTQNVAVLNRFSAILLNITEVLNDVIKTAPKGDVHIDVLVSFADLRPPSPLEGLGGAARWAGHEEDGPHEARRRELVDSHPARKLDLHTVTARQLETLKQQLGPEKFASLIQATDPETVYQLRSYNILL